MQCDLPFAVSSNLTNITFVEPSEQHRRLVHGDLCFAGCRDSPLRGLAQDRGRVVGGSLVQAKCGNKAALSLTTPQQGASDTGKCQH